MTQPVQVLSANVAASAFYLAVDHCAAGVFLLALLIAPGLGQRVSLRWRNTWDEVNTGQWLAAPKKRVPCFPSALQCFLCQPGPCCKLIQFAKLSENEPDF